MGVGLESRKGLAHMYGTNFDPFSECFRFFSDFMRCGAWCGRQFYTRKEKIERLERIKKHLQEEIAGIDEMIEELRGPATRQA